MGNLLNVVEIPKKHRTDEIKDELNFFLNQADNLDGIMIVGLFRDGAQNIKMNQMSRNQKLMLLNFAHHMMQTELLPSQGPVNSA